MSIDAVVAAEVAPSEPGVAVAVGVGGEVVHAAGHGLAVVEYDVPMAPDTVFHVASISKSVIAAQVHQLAAEGRLDLDTDVRGLLPEVARVDRPFTPRQLLWHTSGLRDQWDLLVLAGWRMDDVITTADVLELVAEQRSGNFPPGAEHVYCNTGYTLLGVVVERLTGESLQAHAERTLFGPLGMASTHWHADHRHIVPGAARSYAPASSGFQHAVLSFSTVGATSLWTTAPDLLRWAAWLRSGGGVADALRVEGRLDDGTPLAYGSGVALGRHRGRATVGHPGSDAGFRTDLVTFPETGVDVVVLANLATRDASALARRIADDVHGPDAGPVEPTAVTPEEVERLVARYYDPHTEVVHRVVPHRDGIALAGLAPRSLVPLGGERYRPVGSLRGEVRLDGERFERDGPLRGRAERLPEVVPPVDDADRLAGSYVSDELGVTWDVAPGTGSGAPLVLSRRKHPPTSLWTIGPRTFRATLDRWTGLRGTIRFEGEDLVVSTERARHVRFRRAEATVSP